MPREARVLRFDFELPGEQHRRFYVRTLRNWRLDTWLRWLERLHPYALRWEVTQVTDEEIPWHLRQRVNVELWLNE